MCDVIRCKSEEAAVWMRYGEGKVALCYKHFEARTVDRKALKFQAA